MKTKEQILKWLDEQPWANEFYKEAFFDRGFSIIYDKYFICGAFDWSATKSGARIWKQRDIVFRQWYASNDKPMSWEEYCQQNPIKAGDSQIDEISDINSITNSRDRNEDKDVNTMPEYLCEAFLAYMKLIQLRNAWMKDCDRVACFFKIGSEGDRIVCSTGLYSYRGLSFPTASMAEEFINTFKDLLEVAKPLI